MKYVFGGVLLVVLFCLTGCALMEGLLTEIPEIAATGEANPQIEATLTIVSDFIDDPWRYFITLALGYGSCLFRRWYKKKKGAKSL